MRWNCRSEYDTLVEPSIPPSVSPHDTFTILFAIKSTLFGERELRDVIRETWLNANNWRFTLQMDNQYKTLQVRSLFLLGLQVCFSPCVLNLEH